MLACCAIPAGIFEAPFKRYTVLTLIGSAIWCFVFAAIGWARPLFAPALRASLERVVDYVLADEITHVRMGSKWMRKLTEGDPERLRLVIDNAIANAVKHGGATEVRLAVTSSAEGVEITVEANPETVGPAELEQLRAQGVTRMSFGTQSAVPHVLRTLDRQHQPGRPEQCVRWARAAGPRRLDIAPAHWELARDRGGALVRDGVSLQQLIDGLNALGVGPRDLIAILQAIKAAGAIQADIEVM